MPSKKPSKSSPRKKSEQEKKSFAVSGQNPDLDRRKRWMWFGVAFVFTAIIVLWGWSFKVGFESYSWQNSAEQQLINNVKEDWRQTFNEAQTPDALKDNEKNEIQNTLRNIIAEQAASSSLSSETDNAATVSTTPAAISTASTSTTSTENNT